jgi:hypothetical protein
MSGHNDNNGHIPVEKLEGVQNYTNWKFAIKMLLKLDGLWACVDGDDADANRDSRALAKICLSIKPALFQYVRDATSAKDAWQKLAKAFESKGLYRKVLLLRQLHKIEYNHYGGMSEYIEAVTRLVQQLSDIGKQIDDDEVAEILLSGLSHEHDNLVSGLETACLTNQLTLELVRARLLQEEHRRNGGEQEGAKAYFGNKKKKTTSSTTPMFCQYCKRSGHTIKRCFKRKKELKNNEDHTMLASAMVCSDSGSHEFVVDSGASQHMIANKELLQEPRGKHSIVYVANGNKLHSNCTGRVLLASNINLNNVLHVPDLSSNLLSVSQITDKGYTVVFTKDHCKVFDDIKFTGNQVLIASKDNGLYRYKAQVRHILEEEHSNLLQTRQETANAHTVSAIPMDIWHKRLGHLSESGMRILGDGKNCMNLSFQKEDTINGSCVPCLTGKMVKAPFPAVSMKRTTRPLELIHSDVAGPMQVETWGGARYLLTFTDDYTRKTWGYLMKHKSEVSSLFINFKTMVEKQSDLSIKILRSDNGLEFTNSRLGTYLKDNGIIHQTTVPYNAEQNGTAERGFLTIFNKTRAMLQESGLCNRYWGEAVMTFILKIDLLPERCQVEFPKACGQGLLLTSATYAFSVVLLMHTFLVKNVKNLMQEQRPSSLLVMVKILKDTVLLIHLVLIK